MVTQAVYFVLSDNEVKTTCINLRTDYRKFNMVSRTDMGIVVSEKLLVCLLKLFNRTRNMFLLNGV